MSSIGNSNSSRILVVEDVDALSSQTNEQWTSIITDLQNEILSVFSRQEPDSSHSTSDTSKLDIAKSIDHTLLKLDAQPAQIDILCSEAKEHHFASVCVRPEFVQQSVANLRGTEVKVASVIGFHEGTHDLAHKLAETKTSVSAGAHELDIVINYPKLKDAQEYPTIYNELASLRTHAPRPVVLKLILETSQLTPEQIVAGCVLAAATDLDFVKTSTGFNGRGTSEEDVRLMSLCCEHLAGRFPIPESPGRNAMMRVKASGGIRSFGDAVRMIRAGASRLGASSGVAIANQARGDAGASSGGGGQGGY